MYVDESGTEQEHDDNRFFVVAGVVIHDTDMLKTEREVLKIRQNAFPDRFAGNEIHVHDIYKGRDCFKGITELEKKDAMRRLYNALLNVNFSIIAIAIDKQRLPNLKDQQRFVIEKAYTFLIERFELFLRKNNQIGFVRIDRTSDRPNVLNKKDIKILSTVTDIMIMGSDNIVATSIIEEPLFFNSANSDGLQVADA